MLQNVYLLAKIGADTAENEQHFGAMETEFKEVLQAARNVTSQQGRSRSELNLAIFW